MTRIRYIRDPRLRIAPGSGFRFRRNRPYPRISEIREKLIYLLFSNILFNINIIFVLFTRVLFVLVCERDQFAIKH
ncbi:hypothetical protein SISNIDRAFT_323973 [Sistotremastrum niveocremeum HHB9708]|uniref:Uncharacterized protein n=1 Tax=Sistotremastrum niveocremeum HHB9708 TaxID=1314777 RepID=A0A164MRI9_9AGAM|nr:hypothetical protein SISNIDRAFT_323973 [Sistotremastrum niveocremeum HHB9708]